MGKLEGRLIGVISKRLDQMEYKIDSLVELAVVGRFHSTTSVCDSPICNTTNVHVAQPEVERKEEIGPDDVMDELEKERIIEDETGEELVEGKKAGNDENVSDEIEIVEKRMSTDFLTPEKLEEDANKSTKLKIDLEDRTIFIFDSLKSHVRKAELEAFMKPLQVVIPLLMKLYVKCDDSYSTEQFRFIKMKEFPQQHNGFCS
ncbi:Ulp1 protease family [Forsythia ovata]|uniref:Ulp1 protease family n=1 Tax=Forsythia ovata TaxID=205694 RepID=A0ABD1WBC8_9LAMI